MTLIEFNRYLEENVTDEMFESLILDYLKNEYQILSCNIGTNKIYTLQDVFVGDQYYLIVNIAKGKLPENISLDKYMVASKDQVTLFLLANHIWGKQPREVPANVRNILPFVNNIDDNPAAFFDCSCVDFTERIGELVEKKFHEYQQNVVKLYDKCVDETIKILIQEQYISAAKDWNKKTHKIKLTGAKGENRICECYVSLGNGCVFFTVKEPYYPLHYYLNDEKDIPLVAAQIVQVIKEKRTF